MVHERIKNIKSGNDFLNFIFLNVDISLTMHGLTLKLYRYIENIVVVENVSQIVFMYYRSWPFSTILKSWPFLHKHLIKTKTLNKILRHSSLNVNATYSHTKSTLYKVK